MRSTLISAAIFFLAMLLVAGCSEGNSKAPLIPDGQDYVSPLAGIRAVNTELDDIRIDGESVLTSAYINVKPGKNTLPLEIDTSSAGSLSVDIRDGMLLLPDGTRAASYEGPVSPLQVEPGIADGLVELNVAYTGDTEHLRRYWLAIDKQDDLPIPPFTGTLVTTPEGDEMEICANEMLVALHPNVPGEDFNELLKALDMQALERIIDTDVYRVGFAPSVDIFVAMRTIEISPIVEYAEPNFIRHLDIIPNDTNYNYKWDLNIMDGPEGWDIFQGDSNVIVGVIDTGIDRDHPDLVSKVVNGEDFVDGGDGLGGEVDGDGVDNDGNSLIDDNVGHGTHVAGIIGAMSNNSKGTAGVDWSCKLMGLRIMPANGDGGAATSSITSALNYAKNTQNVVAVNMSIGGGWFSQTEQNVCNSVFNAGVVICASAGNSGSSQYSYPASYDHVVSVAATNSQDKKTSFSQYNDKVDVCAPGQDIYSTYYNNTYAFASGTSMSCPEATGLMALVKGYYPTYSAQEVVDQVKFTADNIYDKNPNYVGRLGTGRINIYRALYQQLRPEYNILGMEYDDDFEGITHGNRDGFFNPGEVIGIGLTVRNDGIKDADDPAGLLDINDPYVHVIKGEIAFPDIPKAETKKSDEMFIISIDDDCPDGHVVQYIMDFDDALGSGPHENPGSWKVFKNEYTVDAIWLEGENLPENGKIFKGIDNQALIRIDVSGDVNYGTIDGLEIIKFGSVATDAITGVRLYHDSDGDGVFDLDGTDKQLATDDYYNAGYSGQYDNLNDPNSGNPGGSNDIPHPHVDFNTDSKAVFHGIYLPATNTQTNSFFIVIDLAQAAISGSTLQVGIMTESNINLRIPDAIDPDCLPLISDEFIVASTWETDVKITGGNSDYSWRPEGATNSQGDIFIVIDDDRNGNHDIYLKKSTDFGATFEDDMQLSTDDAGDFYPTIAIDSDDVIHVVYYSTMFGGNNREIIYMRSEDDGYSWTEPVRITNASGDSRVPDITIGPDDVIHVVWTDDRSTPGEGIYYKQSVDGGDNWSDDLRVAANQYYNDWPSPCVAVGANGNINVCWERWVVSGPYVTGFDVYYAKSENDGASFLSPQNLTPGSGGYDYAIRMVSDPDGNPYLVYHHSTASSYDILCAYSTNGGDSFLSKNLTSDIATSCTRPDISINADGFIDVVYKDNLGGTNNVYHIFSETGINGFNDPVQISFGAVIETKTEWPRVIRGPEKNIYAFWADLRDGQHEIYFNRYLY